MAIILLSTPRLDCLVVSHLDGRGELNLASGNFGILFMTLGLVVGLALSSCPRRRKWWPSCEDNAPAAVPPPLSQLLVDCRLSRSVPLLLCINPPVKMSPAMLMPSMDNETCCLVPGVNRGLFFIEVWAIWGGGG